MFFSLASWVNLDSEDPQERFCSCCGEQRNASRYVLAYRAYHQLLIFKGRWISLWLIKTKITHCVTISDLGHMQIKVRTAKTHFLPFCSHTWRLSSHDLTELSTLGNLSIWTYWDYYVYWFLNVYLVGCPEGWGT